MLVGHRHRVLPGERWLAGEHLPANDAGRVDIGSGVGSAGLHLLGGQVRHRSEDHVTRGHGLAADGADQPEIRDLDLAVRGDQHVLRLHIAVHKTRPVCRRQGAEQRLHDRYRYLDPQGAALMDQLAQRSAVDQLHHQKHMVAIATVIVDGDDPRM